MEHLTASIDEVGLWISEALMACDKASVPIKMINIWACGWNYRPNGIVDPVSFSDGFLDWCARIHARPLPIHIGDVNVTFIRFDGLGRTFTDITDLKMIFALGPLRFAAHRWMG
jgi:hypothetical protein